MQVETGSWTGAGTLSAKTTLNNCVNHSVYIFKKYHLPDYEMKVLNRENF